MPSHQSRSPVSDDGALRVDFDHRLRLEFRGQPHRRDHRQPKRQECRKRGASINPHGYDAGKKIKGKKRHLLVDTQGLVLHAIVRAADLQDRDGGVLLMATLFGLFPFLRKLYADGGYQGPVFRSCRR